MLRPALRSILALLVLVILALGVPGTTQAGSGHSWTPDELNWYGISQRRLNDTRADSDLALLGADEYLWGLAHERARDMHQRKYLAATTPEGSDAGGYMRKDGARYERWAEFRAEDASGRRIDKVAWQVVSDLLNDDAHRAKIVGPYDRLGVAVMEGKGRRVFVILIAKAAPPAPPRPTAAPGSIAQIIIDAALRHGIDPDFFLRVAKCESNLNPRALNPGGPYIGLFQFHPNTFRANGGRDIYDPYDQSETAARMFAKGMGWRHWECVRILGGR
jgi:hypothetical protein